MLDPLSVFAPLPLKERWFVRARAFSAPLAEVAARAPPGKIADVGCGHGLLTAHLALGRADRFLYGVDPDPRKIDWARRGPGALPNVELLVGRVEDLSPRLDASLDAVVVCDVLYLLPLDAWAGFFAAVRRLLRPGGALLLKEAEADGSWKERKCLLQEQVMVRVLGKTRGSGALHLKPREVTRQLLREQGFSVDELVPLGKGYSTPHLLFVAHVLKN